MTKIEELKAAYAASTKGAWRTFEDDESTDVMDKHGDHILTMCGLNDSRDATFIALAHNLMPALLDAAIELTKFIDYLDTASGDGAYEHEIQRALAILEKLK